MSLTLNPLAGGLDVVLWQVAGRNGLLPAAKPLTDTAQGVTGGALEGVADPLYTSDQEAYAQAEASRPLQELLSDMREQAALEEALSMYRKDERPTGPGKWAVNVTSPAELLVQATRGDAGALERLLGHRGGWPDGTNG